MGETFSERRMAENELVFRNNNERIAKGFNELKKIAKEEGQEGLISKDDSPLQFYCECSDEDCRKRIKLRPSRYNKIHKRQDHFVIVCGHEIKKIEQVIDKNTEFCVVEKFIPPLYTDPSLHKTRVDNS